MTALLSPTGGTRNLFAEEIGIDSETVSILAQVLAFPLLT